MPSFIRCVKSVHGHQRRINFNFGRTGKPGSLQVQFEYADIPPIDVFYIAIEHTKSGSLTKLFCSACRNHEFPMSFSEVGVEYSLRIHGLVKITTSIGSFYELVGTFNTKFKVDKTAMNIVSQGLESGVNDIHHLDHHLQSSLHIGMTHHHHTDGATYSVHTDTSFSKTMTFFITLKYRNSVYLLTHTGNTLHYTLPLILKPACHLSINVFVAELMQEIGGVSRIYKVTGYSGTLEFRTYTTKTELHALLQKAVAFTAGSGKKKRKMIPIPFLYRNKPEQYWKHIEQSQRGIMTPYRKDFNGDPSSVINGNLDGLFFSAVLDPTSKQPPPFSFYGPQRFHVLANVIFQPNFRLYFADFYCHYNVHYVTLVLTAPGTNYDLFCSERLPLLSNTENPFLILMQDSKGHVSVHVTLGVHIEILFTECVNIPEILRTGYGHFTMVTTRGRGYSKQEGIPKNKDCAICNL